MPFCPAGDFWTAVPLGRVHSEVSLPTSVKQCELQAEKRYTTSLGADFPGLMLLALEE